MEEFENHALKILVVGDSGVGKTNILGRFLHNRFNPNVNSTSHAIEHIHTLNIGRRKVTAQVWDTPGSEEHLGTMSSLYSGAVGVMIVYDVTSAQSFQNITEWLEDMKEERDEYIVPMLVGNKCDLDKQRAFPVFDAEFFALRNDMLFMEISALEGTDVDFAFKTLLNHCCRYSSSQSTSTKSLTSSSWTE
ncbi:Ras-related protein [Yarrowia sp. B02]|nr:Ras-related protein [Yarrowia sp. B02]